jgi:hypothetical protein
VFEILALTCQQGVDGFGWKRQVGLVGRLRECELAAIEVLLELRRLREAGGDGSGDYRAGWY